MTVDFALAVEELVTEWLVLQKLAAAEQVAVEKQTSALVVPVNVAYLQLNEAPLDAIDSVVVIVNVAE